MPKHGAETRRSIEVLIERQLFTPSCFSLRHYPVEQRPKLLRLMLVIAADEQAQLMSAMGRKQTFETGYSGSASVLARFSERPTNQNVTAASASIPKNESRPCQMLQGSISALRCAQFHVTANSNGDVMTTTANAERQPHPTPRGVHGSLFDGSLSNVGWPLRTEGCRRSPMSAMGRKRTLRSRAQQDGLRLPIRLIALDAMAGHFQPKRLEANGRVVVGELGPIGLAGLLVGCGLAGGGGIGVH